MHKVEIEPVPEELNGSLIRSGYAGGLIISESKAKAIEQEATREAPEGHLDVRDIHGPLGTRL